ncbi:hypothetical protein CEXT_411501 [Caerostris extrusa]|uniref:Uncharacterized protein n=1 Tax=Caerostris extrusa TaxID=172846 RepID=A0AAV4QUV4_CAEEX|nr:hypothetical protein CEXT_411501 [Caerostris extrusa]
MRDGLVGCRRMGLIRIFRPATTLLCVYERWAAVQSIPKNTKWDSGCQWHSAVHKCLVYDINKIFRTRVTYKYVRGRPAMKWSDTYHPLGNLHCRFRSPPGGASCWLQRNFHFSSFSEGLDKNVWRLSTRKNDFFLFFSNYDRTLVGKKGFKHLETGVCGKKKKNVVGKTVFMVKILQFPVKLNVCSGLDGGGWGWKMQYALFVQKRLA